MALKQLSVEHSSSLSLEASKDDDVKVDAKNPEEWKKKRVQV
jgi:hypothetical protein